jgi:hypothetical protein
MARLTSNDACIVKPIPQRLVEAAISHIGLEPVHYIQRLTPRRCVVSLKVGRGGCNRIAERTKPW